MREMKVSLQGVVFQLLAGLVIIFSISACGGGSSGGTQKPDQTLQFNLVVEVTGNGRITSNIGNLDCRANCQTTFNNNDQVVLTAVPDAGYVFEGWTGACSGLSTCSLTMNVQRTVGAIFVEQTVFEDYRLDVTKSGMGTVASTPAGIDCGDDCTEIYREGSQVTLTATPANGYLFSSWSGACSGGTTCDVTMTADLAVTANFIEEAVPTFELAVTVSGNGTVTSTPAGIQCGSDCNEIYNENQSVTLIATPDSGYILQGWSGACSGAAGCGVVMSQERTVTATFVQDTGQQADILIEDYSAPNDAFTISEVPNNASGITWHESLQQYLVVRNNSATIYRYDVNFAYLGQLSISSINSDTEGLGYVGGNEVMVVTENNFAHKLVINEFTSSIDGSVNQTQAYQPLPFSGVSNKGLEGVAVRKAASGQLARVYAVQEGTGLNPNALMRLVYFDIPVPDPFVLLAYDDNLEVVEPFDAEVAFAGKATDLAGIVYDERTGHLIVLSEEQSKALQVNPDTGAIISELSLTGAPQYEGVTIGPNGELVFVSEGNWIRIYELPQ